MLNVFIFHIIFYCSGLLDVKTTNETIETFARTQVH